MAIHTPAFRPVFAAATAGSQVAIAVVVAAVEVSAAVGVTAAAGSQVAMVVVIAVVEISAAVTEAVVVLVAWVVAIVATA
jgi:hypothetical protein